jgi:hypothetical protein
VGCWLGDDANEILELVRRARAGHYAEPPAVLEQMHSIMLWTASRATCGQDLPFCTRMQITGRASAQCPRKAVSQLSGPTMAL